MTRTRSLVLALPLLVAGAARADAPRPPSPEEALVAHLAEARWAPPKAAGFPPGALTAAVAVDPASGASLAYAKFPGGYSLPLHFHSFAEYTVVIGGKATFTVDGKDHVLVAGSYLVIPARVPHKLACAAGAECVVLTRRAGAADYHWVGKE